MLTKRQYQILNACADDWEIFYFLFAHLNYDGQVLPREAGDNFAQYVDDRCKAGIHEIKAPEYAINQRC